MNSGVQHGCKRSPDFFIAKGPGIEVENCLWWISRNLAEQLSHTFCFGRELAVRILFDCKGGVEVDFVETLMASGVLDYARMTNQRIDPPSLASQVASVEDCLTASLHQKHDSSEAMISIK